MMAVAVCRTCGTEPLQNAPRGCLAARGARNGRGNRSTGRRKSSCAGGPEFGPGDYSWIRLHRNWLYGHRWASRDGATDGIGGAAGARRSL